MRYFRYAILAMSATLAVSGSAEVNFNLPDGFSLSDPKWFGQDIGDECRLLQFEDRSFAYVVDVPTKSVLKKQSLGTAWLATDWRYYLPFPNWRGDCSEVVFKDDRHFKPVHFTFPGDQEPYLTRYWVSDANDLPDNETDSEYFAYVADLDSGAVIRKALIGQARIATDYRYHLAVPRWRSDCSEVEFDEARYFQPVHFTFSDDGIPAS